MKIVQLITFLGVCSLGAARPVADEAQAEGFPTELDKRFFYNDYAEKRDVKNEDLSKRFFYNDYAEKRDVKNEDLSKRFFYNDYAEKRDTEGKQPAKKFYPTHDLDKESVNEDLDKRFI